MVEAGSRYPLRQVIGLVAGPGIFLLFLVLDPPAELSEPAWRTAALGIWMAVWWITEAISISGTALLPILMLPVLGITSLDEATAPYANPLIFLFLGGFMIAIAMQRWNLHIRIALSIISLIGSSPSSIILGFIISGAFLSMWVSNTATAMMMLPIAASIIQLMEESRPSIAKEDLDRFFITLLLSIAYSCNIGGIATLIGTPPNALLAAFLSETYGYEISFLDWMKVGVPLVLISLPIMFFFLTRVLYPVRVSGLGGGKKLIRGKLRELGPVTWRELAVALVFGLVAFSWITRSFFLEDLLPGISDAGIAIGGALLLFVIPVKLKQGEFVLTWEDLKSLPWSILVLFGGGLSLAGAFESSGLAGWIGESFAYMESAPVFLLILIVVVTVVFLTEITSNTATTATFLPVLASVAVGIGQHPLLLAFPAAVSASCAFMLPVATPPNAVVYGAGKMSIPQMARAGIWLNLMFIALITLLTYTLLPWIFGIQVN